MNTSNSDISPELFHESLHKDINKPILDYRKNGSKPKRDMSKYTLVPIELIGQRLILI